MASSQEVSLLLSQRLFYNAWLTTAAGRIDTGGIVLFICSTKMHEFGSKVMCETTFTATQCRALSRWVWFKMAEKNESKGDLEPAMRVIMLTVKGKLMKKKDGECSGWALMNFTTGFTTYASGKTATFLFFSSQLSEESRKRFGLLQLLTTKKWNFFQSSRQQPCCSVVSMCHFLGTSWYLTKPTHRSGNALMSFTE